MCVSVVCDLDGGERQDFKILFAPRTIHANVPAVVMCVVSVKRLARPKSVIFSTFPCSFNDPSGSTLKFMMKKRKKKMNKRKESAE